MIVVLWICIPILLIGFALALRAVEVGPTSLERAIAIDVVTSCCLGLLLVTTATTGRLDLLPLVVVMSAIGFIGTTVIARFGPPGKNQDPDDGVSPFSFLDDDAAPVHDDAPEGVEKGRSR